ncbi:MFS transporter [Paractinoplanes hotanensis]|uniref:MFS transporter n=1 Tax=Paractinoplanes hotanensis TaxID=2906497 RepID=A0ABT0Y8S8_9ACTN|nr:MFS transporter [Actinoplanes hotanensis]MCM4082450.1 MFS transporter [Actinoplanes hotanensis]
MTVKLRSPGGVALVTATVLASMVGFVDAYMINVAVPAIGRELPASVTQLQWVLTGYLITVASLLLLAGAPADHFGRKKVLIAGLLVMLVASVACAVTPDPGTSTVAAFVFAPPDVQLSQGQHPPPEYQEIVPGAFF